MYIDIASTHVLLIGLWIVTVQVFWKIMYNYCQIKEWHSKNYTRTPSLDGEEPSSVDIAFNRSYVRQKLDNGLLRVWRVSVTVGIEINVIFQQICMYRSVYTCLNLLAHSMCKFLMYTHEVRK